MESASFRKAEENITSGLAEEPKRAWIKETRLNTAHRREVSRRLFSPASSEQVATAVIVTYITCSQGSKSSWKRC